MTNRARWRELGETAAYRTFRDRPHALPLPADCDHTLCHRVAQTCIQLAAQLSAVIERRRLRVQEGPAR